MKLNQKGVVDLMFVGVLVVLLIVAGFVLWRLNQTDETVSDTVTNTSDSTVISQSTETDTSATTIVKINEWDVSLSIRDADKVGYEYSAESGSNPVYGSEYDSTVDLIFLPGSVENQDCEPGVGMQRASTQPESSTDFAKIGEYYFYVVGAPGACDDDPQSSDNQLKLRVLEDVTTSNLVAL